MENETNCWHFILVLYFQKQEKTKKKIWIKNENRLKYLIYQKSIDLYCFYRITESHKFSYKLKLEK
jgi:hypothetical protein